MRRSKAFTLLEAIVVMVVMTILLAVAVSTYNNTRAGQSNLAGVPLLGAIQSQGRQLASANNYQFPADLSTKLNMSDATFVASMNPDGSENPTGYSTSPEQLGNAAYVVSVGQASSNPTLVGYAVMTSPGNCLVMWDRTVTGGTSDATSWHMFTNVPDTGCRPVITCAEYFIAQGGSDPSNIPQSTGSPSCPAAAPGAPVAPTCLVADVVDSNPQVPPSSATLTWTPPYGTKAQNVDHYKIYRFTGNVDTSITPVTNTSINLLPQAIATGGDSGTPVGVDAGTGVTLTPSSESAWQGTSAFRSSFPQATANSTALLKTPSQPVSALGQYVFSTYVSRPTSDTSPVAVYERISWLKADGSPSAVRPVDKSASGALNGSWTRLVLPATAPSDAAKAVLEVVLDGSLVPLTSDGVVYIDGMMLETGNTVSTQQLPTADRVINNVSKTATTYTDTGLAAGHTYSWYIASVNSAGVESQLADLLASQLYLPQLIMRPTSVSSLTVVNPRDSANQPLKQLDLSWDPVFGATSYSITRSINGDSTYSPLTTVAAVSPEPAKYTYTDSSITYGVYYVYRIAPVVTGTSSAICGHTPKNLGGSGVAVNQIVDPPPPRGILEVPELTAELGTEDGTGAYPVNLSWLAVGRASGYELDSQDGTSDPTAGTWYSGCANGDGLTGCDTANFIYTGAAHDTYDPFVDASRQPGHIYWYRVRATNTDSQGNKVNSGFSNLITNPAPDAAPYAAPTEVIIPLDAPVLTATPAGTNVTLDWQAVPGADSYEVWSRDISGISNPSSYPSFTKQTTISGTTTYLDNGTYTGVKSQPSKWQYKVVAVHDATGVKSPDSNIEDVVIAMPATTATCASPAMGGTAISVSWSAVTGATGYTLTVYNGKGVKATGLASNPMTLPASTLSWDDTGLPMGATRYYEVTADNNVVGVSSKVSTTSFCFTALPPTTATLSFSNINGDGFGNDATLSWTPVASASYYWVFYDPSAPGYTAAGATQPSVADNGDGTFSASPTRAWVVPAGTTSIACSGSYADMCDLPIHASGSNASLLYRMWVMPVVAGSAIDTTASSYSTPAKAEAYPVMSAAPAPSITGYVTRCYSCGTGSTDGGEYANLTVNTTAPWSGTDALGFVSFMRIWQTNQVSGATTYTDWYQPPASSGSTVHPAWRISNFGDTITIRVASCNSNGVGGAARCSAQSSALVLYTTPDNPSLSTSLSGGNDITLSWSVTGNYTGVQIYKDGGYLGAFGGTSMVDSNVVVGRDHVYQIFSYYTVGGRTLYSSAGSSTNGYVATADTGTNFGTNITYSVPSHGTQNGWMGSYALLGHIAYCVDLFYSDPSTAGKYGKYTQVSSFGLGGKYSGGGSASGQDVDEMSYVLGVWGVLGSNARAEAVDHFIRLRTISGSVQTSAESNRWAQVNSSTQVTYFNSMTSGAANYRGPYTISISRPTALRVNVAGTIVVNVMSATGHAVPGVFVNITTNNGDNPHGQATDASGNATFPVIPDYRGSETVTVTTGDLPLSNVYVSSPTIAGYQRLLEAGLNTTLTDSAQYPVG